MSRKYFKPAFLLFAFMLAAVITHADVLPRPEKPAPVIDYAHILSDSTVTSWNEGLKKVQDSTGVQIVVVTVTTLNDADVFDYAQELYDKWGIGDRKTNKGVLILVKPKTGESESGKGRIRIHTGYGMEADLPDAFCKSMIDDLAIPAFRKENYQLGIGKVLNTIVAVVTGKYSYQDFLKNKEKQRIEQQKEKEKQALEDDYDNGLLGSVCCFWPFLIGFWYLIIKRRRSDGLSNWDATPTGGSSSGRRSGGSSSYSDYDSDSSWSSSSSSSSSSSYDYGGGSSGGGGASGSW